MKVYSSLSRCSICIEKQKPYIAMLFVQFAYAGMFLISKAALCAGMNPFIFVSYRQGLATAFLAPFAFFMDRNNGDSLSGILLLKIFVISLFGITLSLNLHAYSMNYTSATFAAASTNTIPLMTFVTAALLRMETVSIKKKHGMAKVLGSAIGFCGAMFFAFVKGPSMNFMTGSRDLTRHASGSSIMSGSQGQGVKGTLIMLLSNMIWSSWLIIMGFLMIIWLFILVHAPVVKEYPAKLRLTTLQCLFSCVQSSIFAIVMEREASSWKLGWDINLFSAVYCGVIVTGLTYWLQLLAVESKGPVFTAMFTPFALIITAIISALAWKEVLHLGSVCGAIMLVGGLYIVLWGKQKEAEGQETEEKEQKSETNTETETIECITHQ